MAVLQVLAVAFAALSVASGEDGSYGCAGDCVDTFKKCSGRGIDGVLDCCSDHDQCVMKNVFFSQCRPISRPIPNGWDGDILTCDDISPPDPCLDGCAGTYQKCGGKNFDGFKACCSDHDQCLIKNEFYSQCRPISKPVPNGWDGTIVDCTDTGGGDVNVICTGEEDDHPIDVEIGSEFTIATTTTDNPDEAGCEVVDGMAPPLPLSGTVFASATGITRTLKCTVTKGDEMAMCQFDITLTGTPNVPSLPPAPVPPPVEPATATAFADDADDEPAPDAEPDVVFFIE